MNHVEFFRLLPPRPAHELALIQCAYWLSKSTHRDQERDGGERYFEHPRRVTLLLIKYGYTDTRSIVLGLLHDIIEDGYVPLQIIVNTFGAEIWDGLEKLSKKLPHVDPITGMMTKLKKNLDSYFQALTESLPWIRVVKLADRLDNLGDCQGSWEPDRIRRYLTETRQYILPLAHATDPRFVTDLEVEIARIEAALAA